LLQLEEHIHDKAEELAEGNEPTYQNIQQAIKSLGSPKEIANEYRKRGTPKVFISEELWPWYLKVIQIVIGIILLLNSLGLVFGIIGGNFLESFSDFFNGMFNGSIYGSFIVTAIFVVLSMEGYLPEDFQELVEYEQSKAEKKEKLKNIKHPININTILIEAIFGLVWGFFLITMPIPSLNSFLGPQMVNWISAIGVLAFFRGIVGLFRVLAGGNHIMIQQMLLGVNIIIDILEIPWIFGSFLGFPNMGLGEAITTIPSMSGVLEGINNAAIYTGDFFNNEFYWFMGFIFIIGLISSIYELIALRFKYDKYMNSIKNKNNYS
ncbi:MAG: hypothetical protein GY870_18885, partial [archaeon]|nr:hypothetical protein [archaeon]